MRDNFSGTQPSENRTEWSPAGNSGLSMSDRPGISEFDTQSESGGESSGAQYTEKIAGAVTQAKDYLGEKATAIGGKIKDFTTEDLGGVANKAKDFARQNPGQAILVSAGVGLLLGLIVRGRR